AAYRRAARIGEGFILIGEQQRATQGWARIEHYLAEAGRTSAQFGKEMVVGRQDRSAQEVAARIEWCREFGCTHVAVDTINKGFATAQAHVDFLAEVRQRLTA
ncbi:MAG: hypothetical protein ACRETK_10940, partial [Steroidobacteraceae bacterium]